MARRGTFRMQLKEYGDVKVIVGMKKYSDGTPVMDGVSDEGPVAMMSVFGAGSGLNKDEILIKSWTENEDIYREMIEQQILLPIRAVPTGYVHAWVCMLGNINWDKLEIY